MGNIEQQVMLRLAEEEQLRRAMEASKASAQEDEQLRRVIDDLHTD